MTPGAIAGLVEFTEAAASVDMFRAAPPAIGLRAEESDAAVALFAPGGTGSVDGPRIHDGADLGCEWFVTETGRERPDRPNPFFHNMLRTGFTVAYHRPNFMPPQPARTAEAIPSRP